GAHEWYADHEPALLAAKTPAAALLVDRPGVAASGAPVLRVADANLALSTLAAELAGRPAERLPIIGVTGTDGKTTTTTLIDAALTRLGRRVARTGTLGAFLAGAPHPLSRTVPEPPELHALFSSMLRASCDVAVMEIGSFALRSRRVDAVPFHMGVFTNLTRDHLDVHGTMEVYAAAKARLFDELLRPRGGWPRALLCADAPAWTSMRAPADRWTYGFAPDADLRVVDPRYTLEGCAAELHTPVGRAALRCRLPGRYNAQNAAAAIGVLLSLDVPLDAACDAVAHARGPAGRTQTIANDRGLALVVDYAHTPNGLRTVLGAMRPLTSGRLWVLFGCGGDRDQGKRGPMGEVASELADEVVLTSDNPRSESAATIVEAIRAGMRRAPTHVELDRSAAIAWTLRHATPGDTVVFAGKGHETYQQIGRRRIPFSDHDEIAHALRSTR
ncbi:MAG: UDP-N-acetylmuramoyl-L-alanyl-D-glutamate--2,6-diaminopimelate ligase, partial [Myxococcales bacterium]|nr:UDP-N-acetylmuramoyl-L-alanyl-D-glutamate--2,6-diaminopimelate ligase [Myxococcales bacterium]